MCNIVERMAERVGFEPTAHCCVTGFQDRLLKPLGHLSESGRDQTRKLSYHKPSGLSIDFAGLLDVGDKTCYNPNYYRKETEVHFP